MVMMEMMVNVTVVIHKKFENLKNIIMEYGNHSILETSCNFYRFGDEYLPYCICTFF